jgi:hypothetical protein
LRLASALSGPCLLAAVGSSGGTQGLDPQQPQADPAQAGQDSEEPKADPAYIGLFLLKYVCPGPDCFGTLAPAGPGSDRYECNMCGLARTEAEFLAQLPAA